MLKVPRRYPPLKALPVPFPNAPMPIGLITLKDRMLTPLGAAFHREPSRPRKADGAGLSQYLTFMSGNHCLPGRARGDDGNLWLHPVECARARRFFPQWKGREEAPQCSRQQG
jgi:hypothetical protein